MSSFGVVYDQEKEAFDWTQFRAISRLDKKSDENLEHYFHSFVAMCRNVCRLPTWKDDGEKTCHRVSREVGREHVKFTMQKHHS